MATTFTSDWISHDRVSREATLARLDALSRLFDVAFVIPKTNVRFGIEAILRLVPGADRGRCVRRRVPRQPPNVRLLRDYFDGRL